MRRLFALALACGGNARVGRDARDGARDAGDPADATPMRDAAAPCPPGRFFGDRGAAPMIEPIEMKALTRAIVPVEEGDTVDLVQPPQGGKILLLGGRVTNMCGDVTIAVNVRYPDMRLFLVMKRVGVIHYVADPDRPGWAIPLFRGGVDAADLANVNVCPDYQTRAVDGRAWRLDFDVADVEGRVATTTRAVTPVCTGVVADPVTAEFRDGGEPFADECRCECAAGFTNGRCAAADVPDGS